MSDSVRHVASLPLRVLSVIMLAACGGEPTAPDGQNPCEPSCATSEVVSVVVTPAAITLMPGEPVLLLPQAEDTGGGLVTPDAYTWTSSDPGVATIEPVTAATPGTHAAVLTAVGEGSATITATADGHSGSVAVTVAVGDFFAFTSVGAGTGHSCGIATDGAAYCWGGQPLGNETVLGTTSTPVAVSGGLTFATLSVGGWHVCGVTVSGAAYCWGLGDIGQLGNGSVADSGIPSPVSGGLSFTSVSVSPGPEGMHTCGVTIGGAAYCWGGGEHGQLGNGTFVNSDTPVAVSGGLSFASVQAGEIRTCGVTQSGVAYCWGRGDEGELGNRETMLTSTPIAVAGGIEFVSVSVGGALHSCGLARGGAAYCWGFNEDGALGNGTTTDSRIPGGVSRDLRFTALSTGNAHTCAITGGGAAYCWGGNWTGQLGNGARTPPGVPNPTPVPVAGRLTFASVSGGRWHTCGVATSGAAYCWGRNLFGMLGNGAVGDNSQLSETWETMPVRVTRPELGGLIHDHR